LYYEMYGDGDPVVFINGTGADLRANPMRGKGLLEQTFEVLMYDQRGLGQSAKPDRAYSMADYADDCAALMTAVDWKRAHVVGVSFGGMVAQHLAIRHPERVNRLVLACTSAGGAGGSSFDLLALHNLPAADRARAMVSVLDSRNDLSTDPPTLAPWFDILLPRMSAGVRLNDDDPDAEMGERRQLEARAGHDVWESLPDITAPTYAAGGRYDLQAPVENMQRLASRIPDCRLEFFDGGHLFFLQDPDAWPVIVDFLRSGREVRT
jgi:3-oxoadipate enol-lactonase